MKPEPRKSRERFTSDENRRGYRGDTYPSLMPLSMDPASSEAIRDDFLATPNGGLVSGATDPSPIPLTGSWL